MNKLKSIANQLQSKLIGWATRKVLEHKELLIVPVEKYTALNLQVADLKEANNTFARNAIAKDDVIPMTPERLLQKQLGSYLPSFEPLEKKSDEFKNSLGRLCRELVLSPEFTYLIDHLKQDQINLSLFEEKKNEEFVRGSINGIYIVADQIQLLGNGYIDRLGKGLIPNTKKVEPKTEA